MITEERLTEIRKGLEIHRGCTSGFCSWFREVEAITELLAEITRLTELARGRLEHFQQSEKSRGFHFSRAERYAQELQKIATLAVQSINTEYGGKVCLQIEQMARKALEDS